MKRREFVLRRRVFAERSIAELIELLAADELQTRFFAEMSLRDATST